MTDALIERAQRCLIDNTPISPDFNCVHQLMSQERNQTIARQIAANRDPQIARTLDRRHELQAPSKLARERVGRLHVDDQIGALNGAHERSKERRANVAQLDERARKRIDRAKTTLVDLRKRCGRADEAKDEAKSDS
jgi:hypothetical protein